MSHYTDLDAAILGDKAAKLKIAQECEQAFKLSRSWLLKARQEMRGPAAEALLGGAHSASIEVVSLAYLGLMRPAIFSLRAHFELAYSWLYYRDHPIEWDAFLSGLDTSRLPGAVDQYIGKFYACHGPRWKTLVAKRERSAEDPYAILSAFVHGNQPNTIPNAQKPSDVVHPLQSLQQLPAFVFAVSECLSDVTVSCYQSNWESLPTEVSSQLRKRFGTKVKGALAFN